MIVLASGFFDPIHHAHVRYLRAAAAHGELHVLVASDECCIRKKGFAFMPAPQRLEIIAAIRGVHDAQIWSEDTVENAIRALRPRLFAKGGDRTPDNMPAAELAACTEVGCTVLYGIGGPKLQSSSELLAAHVARRA